MIDFKSKLSEFEQALLSLDRLGAEKILREAQESAPAVELVEKLVAPALEKMGRDWESGNIALSQIYMGGRICEELVDLMLPPASPNRKYQPKMAISVLEDYHMLGKRIVYSTLRAIGFELLDYGRKDADELVKVAQRDRIEILLISTLMLPSALRVKNVTSGLREAGSRMKVVVGGAPFRFDDQLWKEVGADATSPDAFGAVSVVTALIGGGP
jgi:methanogenic corrinoid protein MtbC1